MVSFKSFAAASIALAASFIHVDAAVAPTYPQPGTVQTVGQSYDITWTFDGKDSQTYQIDFMTGSNDNQTVLQNVAKGVKPTDLKYSFTAPAVDPNSAIYFFMFTGSKGDQAWTTRFGIAGADGKLTTEPESKQPSGDAIPWGNGKLASGSSSSGASAAAVSSAAPASSSIAVAVESANPTAAAISSAVAAASSGVAAVSSAGSAVTQAAASADSAASITKPVLTLVSAAVAGYFAF